MRLIDADALKKKATMKEHCLRPSVSEFHMCVSTHDIDEAPTIDAEPVKHGEWIDKPTGAYRRMQSWCSACGAHSGIGGIESNRHKPFCPNCGAKMDGKQEDKTDEN